ALVRAAVVAAPGRCELRQVEIPEPGAGEALIRLEGCGVCASNLPPWEGRPWFTYPMPPGELGHEGWGEVIEVGPNVTGVQPRDRVATLSTRSYAEYTVAFADSMTRLPRALDGQPFPGEPLAPRGRSRCFGKHQSGQAARASSAAESFHLALSVQNRRM